jgi:hypothetical protein
MSMTTIHVTTHSRLSPERVLAAGHDFSARRAEIFPAVSTPHLEIHGLSHTSADVTEGTPAGVGINWERCAAFSGLGIKINIRDRRSSNGAMNSTPAGRSAVSRRGGTSPTCVARQLHAEARVRVCSRDADPLRTARDARSPSSKPSGRTC